MPKQKFRLMMQGPFLFLLYQRVLLWIPDDNRAIALYISLLVTVMSFE